MQSAVGLAGRGMPTQAGGGMLDKRSPGATAASTSKDPKRGTVPARAFTIKQLLTASRVGEGVMNVDGRDVSQAIVTGRVMEHESAATPSMTAKQHGYRISDGTGMILVREWIDPSKPSEGVETGRFVRVAGSVKMWQDKPVVTGTIQVLTYNEELTYHLFDALLTHLRITQGARAQTKLLQSGLGQGARPSSGPQAPTADRLSCTDAVVRTIQTSPRKETGLTIEEITQSVASYGYPIQDIRQAIRTLKDNGNVYEVSMNRFTC